MLLSPIEHLLKKSSLSGLGGKDDIPNTQKQIQRARQNKDTDEYIPIKRTRQKTQKKELNETGISKLTDFSCNGNGQG